MSNTQQIRLLIDGHVHMHRCFPVADFLDTAFRHFCSYSDTKDFHGILMLTESSDANWFGDIRGNIASGEEPVCFGDWRIHATCEEESIRLSAGNRRELFVIAGSQIVTSEKLEVLSLASAQRLQDGLPVRDVLRWVVESGGIPVLPWGFGKWSGRRGKIVNELVAESDHWNFLMGDNGGRIALLKPRQFEMARERGIAILPGSDPLPFKDGWKRVGATGARLTGSLDPERPAESLRKLLRPASASALDPFGEPESLPRFLFNQAGMQVHKRRRRGTPA